MRLNHTLLLAAFFLCAATTNGQNFLTDALDQTFGVEGAATGGIEGLDGACVMQAHPTDGGFYLFGLADDGLCPNDQRPFLVKHTATGAFDPGFNGGAPLYLDQLNCSEYLLNLYRSKTIAVQPDGKVIVCGRTGADSLLTVLRINGNGTLDGTFGTGGVYTLALHGTSGEGVAVDVQGRIICSGTRRIVLNADDSQQFTLVTRLDGGGAPDATFGTNGLVLLDLDGITDQGGALGEAGMDPVPLASGEILIGGRSFGPNNGAYIIKLSATGSLMPSFANAGFYNMATPTTDVLTDLLVDEAADRIYMSLAAYVNQNEDNSDVVVDCITISAGSAVTAFGNAGRVQIDQSGNDEVYNYDFLHGLAKDNAGFLYGVGWIQTPTYTGAHVWRWDNNGDLTTNWIVGGQDTLALGGDARHAIITDAGLFVAGYRFDPTPPVLGFWENQDYFIAKYGLDVISGLAEPPETSGMTVYPNPTIGPFTVNLMGVKGKSTFTIRDVLGRMVMAGTTSSGQAELDLTNYPNGVYTGHVLTADGIVHITRIIKR